ncbi:glutamate--tRNA ligase [Patescibacteria group bacterium]|nr:glutamate--tRNA ligase [Patescibacteria group bacterium]
MEAKMDNLSAKDVRVRFAPSPTGALHIGSARTALFNYLFAKKNNGIVILRIEDTDKERSQDIFEQDIKENLIWLGLGWDEEYKQSERTELYQKYLDQLINEDKIYLKDGAYYFRTPTTGKIIVDDLIRGQVEFDATSFDDFVIAKSNGDFIFHFVNVIDDWQMQISHVIRGEDHLSNTPKHILLFQALGATPPKYAHIPLILNPDRTKMSKRSGDVNFADYIDKGYLPIALINFLAQLGWSEPSGKEFFDLEELIQVFNLSRVQKAGAVFDIKYLNHLNHHYLNQLSLDEYYKLVKPNWPFAGTDEYHKKVLALLQDRAEYLTNLPELANYFYQAPDYEKDLLIFKKSTPQLTSQGLQTAHKVLSALDPDAWTEAGLQQVLDDTIEVEGLSAGDLFWPVRVALSGLSGSPSPVELLVVLGKEESLNRLEIAITKLNG